MVPRVKQLTFILRDGVGMGRGQPQLLINGFNTGITFRRDDGHGVVSLLGASQLVLRSVLAARVGIGLQLPTTIVAA